MFKKALFVSTLMALSVMGLQANENSCCNPAPSPERIGLACKDCGKNEAQVSQSRKIRPEPARILACKDCK